MKTVIVFILSVILAFWFFSAQTAKSNRAISIGDCVNKKMDEDQYRGDFRSGWEIYAESCLAELK